MAGDAEALLTRAGTQMRRGEWAAASATLRAALKQEASPEALAALGDALWWQGEVRDAVGFRERAYAEFRRRGETAAAVLLAVRLAIDHWACFGNTAAFSGWQARAARLAHDQPALLGWVHLLEGYSVGDPAEGLELARRALDCARDSGDTDLELCALSLTGARLIDQGRVPDGVSCLDEAMAGSLGGEGGSPDTVVFTSCTTIIACSAGAEFERAVQWIRAADRFTERYGCPFLYAECRVLYGAVLLAIGDWPQAEQELRGAVDAARHALPAVHTQALAGLAELRLAQGRVEEAERLLEGVGDEHPHAAAAAARLHLVCGRSEAAETLLRRWTAELGEDRLESVILLELLGHALIAQGRCEAAEAAAGRLAALGGGAPCPTAAARGARLRGRALAESGGDLAQARTCLDAALAGFARLAMPYEAACTRLLLARVLARESPDAAVGEARAAWGVLEGLGARRDADAAASLLRELGVKAPGPRRRGAETLTRREGEVLALLGEGLSNPDIAERLYLSRKTVEHHVTHVLTKLGLRSRAEAAAEAVRLSAAAGPRAAGERAPRPGTGGGLRSAGAPRWPG